jgi:hypothetical protein
MQNIKRQSSLNLQFINQFVFLKIVMIIRSLNTFKEKNILGLEKNVLYSEF